MKRQALCICAAILGAAIALRTLVAWAPALRFDVDPFFDPAPFAGLGPSASLCIDAVIAFSSAIILAECASLWAFGVLVAAACAAWSVFDYAAVGQSVSPWRGVTWVAGFVAAAAGVSLARSAHDSTKQAWTVLVVCLLSVAGAWWTRGAWQWFVEQPAVVEYFHSNGRDGAYFAQHGWEVDGPQAAAYVRRLSQREMSGWFGLANIFAGLFATITVACVAIGSRLPHRARALVFVVALLCAAVPLANGSKGAIVAMLLGLSFLIASTHLHVSGRKLAAAAILLLIACAFAPLMRLLFAVDALGQERSLLFRGHYITGAWKIFLERPWRGSGIDGFQDAFLLARPTDAVDAVQSAHAVFFDWLAQFGIAGIPMICAVFVLLFSSTQASGNAAAPAPQANLKFLRLLCTLVILVAALLAVRVEAHSLDGASFAARLVGVLAAGGSAWLIFPIIARFRAAPSLLLSAAALTVWIDGQIEMTLWNPGSMIWACAILSVSVAQKQQAHHAWFDGGVKWFCAVGAILFSLACFQFSIAALRQENLTEQAAQFLIDASIHAKGEPGAQARMECAKILVAGNASTTTDLCKEAAIDQLMRAAQVSTTPEQSQIALAMALQVSDATPQNTFAQRQIASFLQEQIALQSNSAQEANKTVQAALRVVEMDPRNAGAWLRAARWAAKLQKSEAALYARRCIESDDSMRLDVLMKLRPADRREAEKLLAPLQP